MTQQVSREFGVPVEYRMAGRPFDLDQSTAHELLMVVREALHNAIRHGQPGEVQVGIAFGKNEFRVRVRDDGRGFDPAMVSASSNGHYGLVGMRERVKRIGGTLALKSQAGAGTELTLCVPQGIGDRGRKAASMTMNNVEKIKVMVVDDHPLMRVGVASIVNARSDMTVVAQTGSGEEAVTLFFKHKPDVTLMDLRLPGMSGVDAIRSIRSAHSGARFVVLTTYEGDADIHRALEAGAQGYVIKGMPYQTLVEALQRVHKGGRFLPPPVARALASRMPDSDLSAREQEVLRLLASGKSNKDIASLLGITEATVKCHVSAILVRLDVSDRTEAVVTALQRGLVHL
jgi:DNA-binding NarL/FixJ family response regulator/anti-sigma regulatory factor (Ser/Thr protein kinase)